MNKAKPAASKKKKAAPKRKPAKRFPEHDLQVACVKWLKTTYPDVVYCSTQGGIDQSNTSRIRMCAAGYVKGIPDLMIYTPAAEYHGLGIELKVGNNVPSEWQYAWKEKLKQCKWDHAFVYSLSEFIDVVTFYFGRMQVVIILQ